MNRKIKIVLITLLLSFGIQNSFASAASSSHSHVASKTKIKNYAQKELKRLALKEKIPLSWKNTPILTITKASNEWIVDFKNKKIEDKKRAKISIYLTTYGKIKGANYSGK